MRAAIPQKERAGFGKLCVTGSGVKNLFAAVRDLLGQEGVKYGPEEDYLMEDGSLSYEE